MTRGVLGSKMLFRFVRADIPLSNNLIGPANKRSVNAKDTLRNLN